MILKGEEKKEVRESKFKRVNLNVTQNKKLQCSKIITCETVNFPLGTLAVQINCR